MDIYIIFGSLLFSTIGGLFAINQFAKKVEDIGERLAHFQKGEIGATEVHLSGEMRAYHKLLDGKLSLIRHELNRLNKTT